MTGLVNFALWLLESENFLVGLLLHLVPHPGRSRPQDVLEERCQVLDRCFAHRPVRLAVDRESHRVAGDAMVCRHT